LQIVEERSSLALQPKWIYRLAGEIRTGLVCHRKRSDADARIGFVIPMAWGLKRYYGNEDRHFITISC
jgi:hypothetical protein